MKKQKIIQQQYVLSNGNLNTGPRTLMPYMLLSELIPHMLQVSSAYVLPPANIVKVYIYVNCSQSTRARIRDECMVSDTVVNLTVVLTLPMTAHAKQLTRTTTIITITIMREPL